MPRKIGLLTLLTWLRRLRPTPDWSDAMATRDWLLKLLLIIAEQAADTETLFDDKLLFIAHRVVDNKATWAKFHALVLDLIANQLSPTMIIGAYTDLAFEANVDPEDYRQLIAAVIAVVE